IKTQDTGHMTQDYLLAKAKDKLKDQSYFLYRLGQSQLRRILFPLGDYTKEEVRGFARKFGLAVANKPGSQEICFLPEDDYRAFLKKREKQNIKPGLILDQRGNILGRHQGIAYYTIGQRAGLGIALGYPAYITKIDPRANRIFLGGKDGVLAREFLLKNLHFICKDFKKKVAAGIKIRYNHQEAKAKILAFKNKTKVIFQEPQFAITPGQSAVFYEKEVVLGGGIIERVLREKEP
ncbi:MAG: tRNA 2-thiouridine(34) synthase MnmA, partial [Candidatus Omnitrophota bacterium]|nr:tRNA 2-thiouridine(34) synthase MnmA [Candidatus Omnitrophota bacterium]